MVVSNLLAEVRHKLAASSLRHIHDVTEFHVMSSADEPIREPEPSLLIVNSTSSFLRVESELGLSSA